MKSILYIAPGLDAIGVLQGREDLEAATERHAVTIDPGPLTNIADPLTALAQHADAAGAVFALKRGLPDRRQLRAIGAVLAKGLRVWLYWPDEHATETVDAERFASLRRHWVAVAAMDRVGRRLHRVVKSWNRVKPGLRWIYRGAFPVRRYDLLTQLDRWSLSARPVPFAAMAEQPSPSQPVHGAGLYLRMDFWSRITSGGSYGHTCYVARELANVTDRFVCLLSQRFDLLDTLGVQQAVMDPPTAVINEDAIATAPEHYYPIVKAACQVLKPAYIYERIVLGNYVAALLSRELQIPYIVEYNGSEISMQRSFDKSSPYFYEDVYLKAEEMAFRQATIISVISEPVRDDLVARGIDAGKIVVNPNGADLVSYAPAPPEEKRRIRETLGFGDGDCVIGFTGTFGGWHGIDVLSAAIPQICAALPEARFLIIGDGNHKPQLDAEVSRHGLDERVRRVGRVPQAEGARLLKACDIYVSPHNTHMIDSKFFGSPTKIFEYMAMGGGIVASDLEQIGEILSPAMRLGDLRDANARVKNQRSVLCTPGDLDEFTGAVVALARRPDLSSALGANARQAVADQYSWAQHVARLWAFARQQPVADLTRVTTGDAYKDQVQHQWNNNPVGSEAARTAQPHTLEWFLEVERYRYGVYAPWMPSVMEFAGHRGERVLEIGGGMGTDLAQFARAGASVTDVDLSAGHLALARENFQLRGLNGEFVHHDAESLPFESDTFDLVYSNGVLHHTPNTARAVDEILRVLKPGGRVIAMFYAENSLQYWRNLVWHFGIKSGDLSRVSMADIMSRTVELTANDARPLVKVYTKARLRALFRRFEQISIVQRQIAPELVPRRLRALLPVVERMAGWNLIIKARKPSR